MIETLTEQNRIVDTMIQAAEIKGKSFSADRVFAFTREIATALMANVINEQPVSVGSSSEVTSVLTGKHYLQGESEAECYLIWLTQSGAQLTVRSQKYSWPAGMR